MHYILCCNTSVDEGFNSFFKVSVPMTLVLGDNNCEFKSDLLQFCGEQMSFFRLEKHGANSQKYHDWDPRRGALAWIISASIAQGLEHWSCKPGVVSSNLTGGFFIF